MREQFRKERQNNDSSLVDLIPKSISHEDNKMLNKMPTMEEIIRVIFTLNGNSSSGPDDLNGHFIKSAKILLRLMW